MGHHFVMVIDVILVHAYQIIKHVMELLIVMIHLMRVLSIVKTEKDVLVQVVRFNVEMGIVWIKPCFVMEKIIVGIIQMNHQDVHVLII